MPKIVLSGLLAFAFLTAHSQRVVIQGHVVDSATRRGLPSATISLVRASDSALLTFGIADTAGHFRLTAAGAGPFLVSVSYTGYQAVWKSVTGGMAGLEGSEELGEVELVSLGLLQAAQVRARRPPVVINNDTIEFNAENFKTQPNAVVEDMLRKIPGVTVESDGTVKVNGQTVRRVLVNGKEFFTGDVKMATKNLNADAVDKLQVFDRQSDQSAFTGVDDGNSQKTINIQLKKDRSHAVFGKLGAGAGLGGAAPTGSGPGGLVSMDGRFDGQGNINRFDGDQQLSFLGMANNTNRQGFTLMDVLNFTGALSRGMQNGAGGVSIQMSNAGENNGLPVTGLGQSQQGIAQTTAGGVNYNDSWQKGRTTLNSNYTTSDIRLVTERQLSTANVGDTPYVTLDTTHTVQQVKQQRVGLVLDQQVNPSFSWRLTPTLTWQHSNKSQAEGYSSSAGDSLLNDGTNQTGGGPGAWDLGSDLLFRKKLAKKGRTLSLDLTMAYNHSTDNGSQVSDNTFAVINEQYHRDAVTRSAGGNLSYTEPVGDRALVFLTGFYNVNMGNTDKATIDYDAVSGKYDLSDPVLSNHFNSDYRYGGGAVGFRANGRKIALTTKATIQAATLRATDLSGGSTITQHFTDLLPAVLIQYNFSRTRNLRLDYHTFTVQPSVVQLQPVADLSNPLDVSTGNPGLKRSYNHQLLFSYIDEPMGQRNHWLFMLGASDASDAIVQSDSVTSYGTRMTMPVNVNGVGSLQNNTIFGFPIRKWHSQLEVGYALSYSVNAAYVNHAKNTITGTRIRPNLAFDYDGGEKFDLSAKAAVSLISGQYSLQPELNTHYVQQHYEINTTNYLKSGVSVHNELDWSINTGRPTGYNTSTPLWNLAVAKTVLRRDRGEIKLSVMDVLGQNRGITRSIEQGSVQDEKYNVLGRYFLLSFTYSLNKSGLKARGLRMKTRILE